MDGRQRDDGTLVPRQFLLGDAPAVEEQQRRQEQQEEDVGIEHTPRSPNAAMTAPKAICTSGNGTGRGDARDDAADDHRRQQHQCDRDLLDAAAFPLSSLFAEKLMHSVATARLLPKRHALLRPATMAGNRTKAKGRPFARKPLFT